MQIWKDLPLVDKIVVVVAILVILYFLPDIPQFLSDLLSYLTGIFNW